jgi:hypothetical protein
MRAMVQSSSTAQADAFAGSERGRKRRPASVGMTVVREARWCAAFETCPGHFVHHRRCRILRKNSAGRNLLDSECDSGAGFVDHFLPDAFAFEDDFDDFAGRAFAADRFGHVMGGLFYFDGGVSYSDR